MMLSERDHAWCAVVDYEHGDGRNQIEDRCVCERCGINTRSRYLEGEKGTIRRGMKRIRSIPCPVCGKITGSVMKHYKNVSRGFYCKKCRSTADVDDLTGEIFRVFGAIC